MSTRAFTTNVCGLALLCGLALTGCGGSGLGSGVMTETPSNWSSYEGRSVKLHGSAANSGSGPFIRMQDGGRLRIEGLAIWPIDYATRPVGVEGTVVKGTDDFADRYVLKLDRYYRIKTDQQPISMTPPEPEQQNLPGASSKKKK